MFMRAKNKRSQEENAEKEAAMKTAMEGLRQRIAELEPDENDY